jgi:hypothetical protein
MVYYDNMFGTLLPVQTGSPLLGGLTVAPGILAEPVISGLRQKL